MDRSEVLRSIRYDLVEYIQKKVRVDFDSFRHIPISFNFGGNTYMVDKVLGRFRTQRGHPLNAFLVNVNNDDVYFLYFHFCDPNQSRIVFNGCWILCFRILGDHELMAFDREDRKMLVNMMFNRVVLFHGHMCPDLVIGGKLCEYVKKLLSTDGELEKGMSVIAENCTSALDAIQVMLGATLGNQRLQVMDFGKHNYTLLTKKKENSLRFLLRQQQYGDEDEYNELERKIINNQVILDEVVQFQNLLDRRVEKLIALPPEGLFKIECVDKDQQPVETASVYLTCSKCGQQVLKSRIIDYRKEIYCIPCFQEINVGCQQYAIQ